jgi:hypothetical protein
LAQQTSRRAPQGDVAEAAEPSASPGASGAVSCGADVKGPQAAAVRAMEKNTVAYRMNMVTSLRTQEGLGLGGSGRRLASCRLDVDPTECEGRPSLPAPAR